MKKLYIYLIVGLTILVIILLLIPQVAIAMFLMLLFFYYVGKKSFHAYCESINNVNCDEIYEYIHESLLEAVKTAFQISGVAYAPKRISVRSDQRYVYEGKDIFYRYAFMVPEDFVLDKSDLRHLINKQLEENIRIGEWIPIVCQVRRRGQMFGIIATTCSSSSQFYEVLNKFEETDKNGSNVSKKDDDF